MLIGQNLKHNLKHMKGNVSADVPAALILCCFITGNGFIISNYIIVY